MGKDPSLAAAGRRKTGATRPAKRQQYVLVACERCKKRKTKCSGGVPCWQCAKRAPADCVYDRILPLELTTLPPNTQKNTDPARKLPALSEAAGHHDLHPLSRSEALEFIESFTEDVEMLYPFIDLLEIKSLVNTLYNCKQQRGNNDMNMPVMRWDDQDDRNVDFLKVLLACSMSTKMRLGEELRQKYVSTVEANNSKRLRSFDVDVKDVAISTMLSVYDFLCDNLKLAWRKIASAARCCLELGLHQINDPAIDTAGRPYAGWETKMFWCVYILDRRYSFMTSLPFALQDRDIDFNILQWSKLGPYMLSMVNYGRLGGEIMPVVPKFGSHNDGLKENICTSLGRQIDQWACTTNGHFPITAFGSTTTELKRLRHSNLFFRIRANQMRLSLYKHSLYSTNNILKHPKIAILAVQAALDNITALSSSQEDSDHVREFQGLQFKYFLISALVVLHLAIRSAPHQFGKIVSEYAKGLETLKSISISPIASENLGKTVRILEGSLGNLRLGLLRYTEDSLQAQIHQGISPIPSTADSNERIADEASRVFSNASGVKGLVPWPSDYRLLTTTITPESSSNFDNQEARDVLENRNIRISDPHPNFSLDYSGLNSFWQFSSDQVWPDQFWND